MKQKVVKTFAVFLAINILFEVMFPTVAYALTGGPSQPEVQSFEPVGTTEMVDISSGDFVYNIPLLDVDGYPINLSYHSGVTMDQEASWVGLGWNINPGVINRNMRGVPDDFNGDEIQKDMYIKPNYTYGLNIGATWELFGFKPLSKGPSISLSASYGIFYNNYKGVGFEESITPAITAGQGLKVGGSLAISSNTQSGMSIAPSANLSLNKSLAGDHTGSLKLSVGTSVNSRSGIKTLTFSKGLGFSGKQEGARGMKDKQKSNGLQSSNNGSSISSAGQSYTPQISMSMFNVNVSARFTLGGELWGLNPDFFVSGYYSRQGIDEEKKQIKKSSYGYLYTQESNGKTDVLQDVNREKDGAYSKSSPTLPITTYAYDMYAVSGQGIGGMYRPHRGDVVHLHDDEMTSGGGGGSAGFELGFGTGVKYGGDVNGNYSYSQSGKWEQSEGNGIAYIFQAKKKTADDPFFEPAYFKNAGEKTPIDENFISYKDIAGPLRPAFKKGLLGFNLIPETEANKFIKGDGEEILNTKVSTISSSDKWVREKREKRNQNIQYLTYADKKLFVDYKTTTFPNSGVRKNHHIGEIIATNNAGSRYVYGIAAYNISQEEISFSNKYIDNDIEITSRCKTGLATYFPSYHTSKKGEMTDGYDGYYNATTLPAYAHSYLLTSVLSPDYVDVSQNGVTDDDLGTYTKINYDNKNENYRWRTPYSKAMHNEGLKSDNLDDKASFIYGKKEIWHVNSIESKNYIAEFEVGERMDGLGVIDIDGDKDESQKSYYLKSITLYAKKDGIKTTTPIKTVYFEYDYSLCPDVDNNTGDFIDKDGNTVGENINESKGKLTLKKVYFTYGNSKKGKLNTYQFTYSEHNPAYDIKGYDRWGNYKPNGACTVEAGMYPNNAEFPYVSQGSEADISAADIYAESWSLKKIALPSGGEINVEYEADDYAYVQNKKAMQMVGGNNTPQIKMTGLGNDRNSTTGQASKLYDDDHNPYDYIYIQLTEPCSDEAEFEKLYMPEQVKPWDNTTYLYYNFLVDITKGKKEYIRGYAEIDNNYRCKKISSTVYSLKLRGVHTGDDSGGNPANAIAKAAWQYARINLPHLVYPGSDMKKDDGGGNNMEIVLRSLVGVIVDLFEMIDGINDRLLANNFAQNVDLDKSWIRLGNGSGKKEGGGVRVKKISLSDNWDAMRGLSGTPSEYGQEYDYTTTEDGKVISSGVASYEPMIGNDENPFRKPVMYNKETSLVPDEKFYAEEPFGETFFPSPSVVYAKVTVRNIHHADVTKHATGKVVHEFYTARDFPTIVDRTNQQSVVEEPDWISGIFSFKVKNHATISQGYQIELNDMHGKPKAEWVYAEPINDETEGRRISGMQYFYKTDANNSSRLDNTNVKVINSDGSVTTATVGIESDMVLDSRESESTTISGGAQGNNDLLFVPPFFLANFPIILPSYSSDHTLFRSAVITRVVQRYGLLDRTIAYQDNSVITTQNDALDAETGEVLLTKTQNEYHDDIYNLTYPAHWAYEGMGLAYKNTHAFFTDVSYSYATGIPTLIKTNFVDGDEVHVIGTTSGAVSIDDLYWEITVGSERFLINTAGTALPTGTYSFEIVRSGRRNMQNTPISQVTSKVNPISGLPLSINGITETSKIINASASAFSDVWKTNCMENSVGTPTCIVNPTEMQDLLTYFINGNMLDAITTNSSTVSINQSYSSYYNSSVTHDLLEECDDDHAFTSINTTSTETEYDVPYTYYTVEPAYNTNESTCTNKTLTHTEIMQLIYNRLALPPFSLIGYTYSEMSYTTVTGGWSYSVNAFKPGGGTIPLTITILNNGLVTVTGSGIISGMPVTVNGTFDFFSIIPPCAEGYSFNATESFNPGPSDYTYHYQCCSTWVEVHPAETTYHDAVHDVDHHYRTLGYTITTCDGKEICASFKYEETCGIARTITSIAIDTYGTVTITFAGSPACSTTATVITCDCVYRTYYNCNYSIPYISNIYLAGLRGNWRPLNNYLYLDNREYAGNVRYDGNYASYSPYWSVTGGKFIAAPTDKWVWTSQTSNYLPQGMEIENKDKLGRYNAALFSNNRMAVAVANNAQYREVFVDNFESINSDGHCFNFTGSPTPVFDDNIAHSGNTSLVIAKNNTNERIFCLAGCNAGASPVTLCEDNCNMPFAPYPTKTYVISGWVKTEAPMENVSDRDAKVTVSFIGENGVFISALTPFLPKGTMVDGWQKFEEEIEIPATAQRIKVALSASVTYDHTWFDDIRMFPFNGNMKSYVYDPFTLKLMAELDENNYATFYEYDEQGALKRIKKETERGVVTIKETRNHMKRSVD